MCNSNEVHLTQKERRTIKEGYKIFSIRTFEGKLKSYWQNYIYKNGVWNKARGTCTFHDQSGFYVFLNKEDAEAVIKYRHEEFSMTVKKVQIRSLIAIGDASEFLGCDLVSKHGVVRCKYVKIVD